jgi:outer membrane protein
MHEVRRLSRPVLPVVLAALAAGCASLPTEHGVASAVSPAPGAVWTPPPEARKPPEKDKTPSVPLVLPSDVVQSGGTLTLAQAIDLSLRNSPVTREAWFLARAAAADVGSKRGAWYPSFELDANITRQKQAQQPAQGGTVTTLNTSYGPSLSLNWLLLDAGGRQADIDEAKAALFSSNWLHDASIQNVVLDVSNAYYQYLYGKALVVAQEANVKTAKESLTAAEERHRAGVATIADVLLARTAASQTELDLVSAQGLVQTIRGALATELGVPANIPVEAGDLPEIENLDRVSESVDRLIETAAAERPDLAARRLDAEKAAAHVRSVRSAGLPALMASGSIGRSYFENPGGTTGVNVYSGAILFRFPVFSGFSSAYAVRQAEEEARAARAQLEDFSNQVVLQVWRSYYGVQTAAQRVRTTRDLLASARQAEEVASGRYKAGVGGFLDLLAAQSAFANARAQEVQARTEWYLAMAQIAHDVGALGPTGVEKKL